MTTTEAGPADVLGVIDAAIKRFGERVALEGAGRRVTYAEMGELVHEIAGRLSTEGAGPSRGVGVALGRSLDWVIAVLATWRTHATVVVLDPSLPTKRRDFMMKDAAPVCIVDDSGISKVASKQLGDGRLRLIPPAGDDAGRPCYVVYTSGTTGTPKGILMPHLPIVNLIRWQTCDPLLAAAARTLQFSALGFDVVFQELLSTFAAGGTIVLGPNDRRSILAQPDLLDYHHIERIFLPPAALSTLVEACETTEFYPTYLRDVVCAGERLVITQAIRRFFCRTGSALHNHYGPAETHVVTALSLAPPPNTWPTNPAIGRALPHASIDVVCEDGRIAEIGEVGEICIHGQCLADGYLNDPDRTAARFVWRSTQTRCRMYKTGDLGVREQDGQLRFCGRVDDQMKIRGVRVEPSDIEAVARSHDSVLDAAAIGLHDERGQSVAVAVSLRRGCAFDEPALRVYLAQRLQPEAVPVTIIEVESIPTTSNGKIDREVLARWLPRRSVSIPNDNDGSLEGQIARVWADVLGTAVTPASDFFEIGGDSLAAARIAARLSEILGTDVPLSLLFDAASPAEMAQSLAKSSATS